MKAHASIAKKLTISIVTAIFIVLTIAFVSILYYSNSLYKRYLLKEVEFQENRIGDALNSVEIKLRTSAIYIENMTRLAYEPTNILKDMKKTFPYVDQILILDEKYIVSNVEPFDGNIVGTLFNGVKKMTNDELSFVYNNRFYTILPSTIEVGTSDIPIGFVVINYNLNALFESIKPADLLLGVCYGDKLIFNSLSGKFEKDICKINNTLFEHEAYFSKHNFLNNNFSAVFVVDKFYAKHFRNRHLTMLLFLFVVLLVSSFSIVKVVSWRVTNPISKFASKIGDLQNDLTRTKFLETGDDEVSVLAKAVNTMLGKIEVYQKISEKNARLATIGESTAMVAHDVRKPLTSIKAFLAMLPEKKDDPAFIHAMSQSVEKSIRHTNTMLSEILEFSKDAKALDSKTCDPQSLITAALSDILRSQSEKNVSIEYDLKYKNSLFVDSERIIRVLCNIIGNAVDMFDKSGCLWFRTEDIIKNGKTMIVVTVGNNGPSIPEDVLKRIFDPFFTQGKKGGTGLGLSICRKIADMHEGKISVKNLVIAGLAKQSSEQNYANEIASPPAAVRNDMQGVEFTIELPANNHPAYINEAELIRHSDELKTFREEESKRIGSSELENTASFMRLHKERGRASHMLIVDDEPLFRESVRSLLNQAQQVKDHVKIVEADSAETALKQLEAKEFDYIITDIDMGKRKMNGYEFAQDVLKKYPNAHVLIHSNKRKDELDRNIREIASGKALAMTASGVIASRAKQSLEGKFMGFLPKPMKVSELLQFLACKTFEAPPPSPPPNNRRAGIKGEGGKNILVVNDDDALLLSYKMMLKSNTVQVLGANNVSSAIEKLMANSVDIILSDINLGDNEPDGYEFLRKVREKNKDIPFYMVSGFSRNEEEPKAKQHGATGYLQQPFEWDELKELIL